MNPTTDNNQQPLAATYSDALGREHTARLDFVKLRAIRAKAGIDFGNLPQIGKAWAEFLWDDAKALDAIWIAISDDGESTCTQDEWLAAMDGVILDEARRAMAEAIENFTPPLLRKILLEGMGAVQKAYVAMIEEAHTKIKSETKAAIDRAVNKVRHGTPRRNARGSSATSTNAGASVKPTGP